MARFKILPGLPGTGPRPIPIPAKSRAEHSEGLVVQFFPETAPAWVGNFAAGLLVGRPDGVFECHDGRRVLVVSGGDAWVVDPEDPNSPEQIDNWTTQVIDVPEHKLLILCNPIAFLGLGPNGLVWKSQRISWDGFRGLAVDGAVLTGESWTPVEVAWVRFRLDITNGRHQGGAYGKNTPQLGDRSAT
jgi:hypothetical protein